jgi:hypothetical protein
MRSIPPLNALRHTSRFCCGLMELGDFNGPYNSNVSISAVQGGYAHIAVTTKGNTKERKWLKRVGFRSRGRWRNPQTKNMLTLWVYMPQPPKATKKKTKRR